MKKRGYPRFLHCFLCVCHCFLEKCTVVNGMLMNLCYTEK